MLDLEESITVPIGGSRASKRVMALQEQDQPPRITRQRLKELSSQHEVGHGPTADPQEVPTEVALTDDNGHTQSNDQN